jgi:hypothetical protein
MNTALQLFAKPYQPKHEAGYDFAAILNLGNEISEGWDR